MYGRGRGKRWTYRGIRRGGASRQSSQGNNNRNTQVFTRIDNGSSTESSQRGTGRKQKSLIPCPFQRWSTYFPDEAYIPGSFCADKAKILKTYFGNHTEKYPVGDLDESCSICLDYSSLASDEDLLTQWSSFGDDLQTKPEKSLLCMAVAFHQVLLDSQYEETPQSYPVFFDLPQIFIRIVDFKPVIPLKSLKANCYGKLVAVKGTVVRVSNVKPLVQYLAFTCNTCGELQDILLSEGRYVCPTKCVTQGCRARSFTPQRSSPRTKTIDWQIIRVQELVVDENREAGRIPRTVECELTSELVDSCTPGDLVTVTGIVKVSNTEENGGRHNKDKCTFALKINANSVYNSKKTRKSANEDGDQVNDFTIKELYAIQEINKERELFRLIVASLCPSIYGHELVKAGLILALFGGNQRFADDKNRIPIRGDPHILVVGDPGLGKSQMLQAVANVAPRGVYVCGNTTTTSGLTVTLSKESGSSDYALEAGALVLGDQGCCCIDEFDKMGQQHQALLEAMEQQSISIAKAGLVCSLPARTSILAAANPIDGHYNKAKTVSENLRMNSALLSRFDLVFILLDNPDEKLDSVLSEHVMALHTGQKRSTPKPPNQDLTWISQSNNAGNEEDDHTRQETKPLAERLKVHLHENMDILPAQLLRKYIAYARKYVVPILSREAAQIFQDFYLQLRRQHQGSSTIPITTRQLESLIRLGEARARIELREHVTIRDAEDVVEIMKYSMIDTYSDDIGFMDFNRSLNGSGMSKRKQMKRFVQELTRVSERDYNTLFSVDQMTKIAREMRIQIDNIGDFVMTLNNQGYLLKKGPRVYQLQTASGL